MFELTPYNIVFAIFSFLTIAFAFMVAFSRNLIYSVFSLLGVFAGVLGLYVLLSADFVAVVQFVIYIGGVLVLILFAVMFSTKTSSYKFTNRAFAPLWGLVLIIPLGFVIFRVVMATSLATQKGEYLPTTAEIGRLLLGKYLLPFEVISILLVLTLVGAVVVGRREVR